MTNSSFREIAMSEENNTTNQNTEHDVLLSAQQQKSDKSSIIENSIELEYRSYKESTRQDFGGSW